MATSLLFSGTAIIERGGTPRKCGELILGDQRDRRCTCLVETKRVFARTIGLEPMRSVFDDSDRQTPRLQRGNQTLDQ